MKFEYAQLVTDDGNVELDPKSFVISEVSETVKIPLTSQLNSGKKYNLKVNYYGELGDNTQGFYRTNYRPDNEEAKYIAITRLQPTFARKVFPCIDQPDVKAVFSVKINHKKEYVSLSNNKLISRNCKESTGLCESSFENTPPMSTYLVTFIVGDLEYAEGMANQTLDGMPIYLRVYTYPGNIENARYTLEYAIKAFEFYSETLKMQYPMSKLDSIILKHYPGAMENWGIVAYGEKWLINNNGDRSMAEKYNTVRMICHETAHHWVGNLVSIKNWSDLWLNEGIANWIQNYCADSILSGPDTKERYYFEDYQWFLKADSLIYSKPLVHEVKTTIDAQNYLGPIVYMKGAAVSNMLENFFGKEFFLNGLIKFLTKHSFKNANSNDLWEALGEFTNVNVKNTFDAWVKSYGLPLIYVSETDDPKVINLKQTQFPTERNLDLEKDTIWSIPLSLSTSSDPNFKSKTIFSVKNTQINIESEGLVDENTWYNVNTGLHSMERVKYSDNLFANLLKGIENGSVDVIDTVAIILDNYEFINYGLGKTTSFFRILQACKKEQSIHVWKLLVERVYEITQKFYGSDPKISDLLPKFAVKYLFNLANKADEIKNDKDNKSLISARKKTLKLLWLASDQIVLGKSHRIYEQVMFNDVYNSDEMEMDSILFSISISGKKMDGFNVASRILLDDNISSIKKEMAKTSLGFMCDKDSIAATFHFALSDKLKNDDGMDILISLVGNLCSKSYIKHEVMENIESLKKIRNKKKLEDFLLVYIENFDSIHEAIGAVKFLENHGITFKEQVFRGIISVAYDKAEYLNKDFEDVKRYLQDTLIN
ncbi:Puromycin-sensitive aminopeptidase [Smittium mucronatum]|uniref:Aminopeptidase n=1 Tax=Smittium mucronatum TaxID=133383 RepID=A0A1R0H5M2_9FUNG|nr:Puromycin-sensitive aminopeptidase [Smittium mucronatum]